MMQQNILIVGGTSGLGLDLAKLLAPGNDVRVTGRRGVEVDNIWYHELELDTDLLAEKLDELVESLPTIDLFIYAAGFYQEAPLHELTDADIQKMYRVGLHAPVLLLARLLRKQTKLPGFIAITSTSQWKARPLEPMYTATKAGLGMLASSLSLDLNVDKVMVAAPAAMNTHFWETARDPATVLVSAWVAQHILEHWWDDFQYKFVGILREPPRVEVYEIR